MNSRPNSDVMPGSDSFGTTQWTALLAGRGNPAERQASETLILEQYWKPVFCYLRRRRIDHATAADLTQEFFTEIVLGRSLLDRADRKRGRFRSFLLKALNNFLIDRSRLEAGARRRPDRPVVSLSGLDPNGVPEPAGRTGSSPEAAFHHRWAVELLRRVLGDVQNECRRDGLDSHWEVFRTRWMMPLLEGAEPVAFDELCRRHGIATVKQASNMLQTIRRRFSAVLTRHVRGWVNDDREVEQEIHDLMAALSGAACDD